MRSLTPTRIGLHLNACLDAKEKELEYKFDFKYKCPVCTKDLTKCKVEEREKHMNKCSKIAQKRSDNAIFETQEIVCGDNNNNNNNEKNKNNNNKNKVGKIEMKTELDVNVKNFSCMICDKNLSRMQLKGRIKHMKKCATNSGFDIGTLCELYNMDKNMFDNVNKLNKKKESKSKLREKRALNIDYMDCFNYNPNMNIDYILHKRKGKFKVNDYDSHIKQLVRDLSECNQKLYQLKQHRQHLEIKLQRVKALKLQHENENKTKKLLLDDNEYLNSNESETPIIDGDIIFDTQINNRMKNEKQNENGNENSNKNGKKEIDSQESVDLTEKEIVNRLFLDDRNDSENNKENDSWNHNNNNNDNSNDGKKQLWHLAQSAEMFSWSDLKQKNSKENNECKQHEQGIEICQSDEDLTQNLLNGLEDDKMSVVLSPIKHKQLSEHVESSIQDVQVVEDVEDVADIADIGDIECLLQMINDEDFDQTYDENKQDNNDTNWDKSKDKSKNKKSWDNGNVNSTYDALFNQRKWSQQSEKSVKSNRSRVLKNNSTFGFSISPMNLNKIEGEIGGVGEGEGCMMLEEKVSLSEIDDIIDQEELEKENNAIDLTLENSLTPPMRTRIIEDTADKCRALKENVVVVISDNEKNKNKNSNDIDNNCLSVERLKSLNLYFETPDVVKKKKVDCSTIDILNLSKLPQNCARKDYIENLQRKSLTELKVELFFVFVCWFVLDCVR